MTESLVRIMVVDDSETVITGLVNGLSDSFDVTTAEHGGDALEKIEASSEEFKFFLVDINMPVMNGIDLTKKIRELPQYTDTPVYILTTESFAEEVQMAEEAGADSFIVKPVAVAKLKKLIGKAIKRS